MSTIELPQGEKFDVDLGDNHVLQWVTSSQAHGQVIGAVMYHLRPQPPPDPENWTDWCAGSVMWEKSYETDPHPLWTKTGDLEHLTLSPSLLCSCGDHGFIREGKWVRA